VNVADISCPESEPVRAPIRSPSSPRDKRGNGRGITLPGSDFEGFVAAGPVGSGARFESNFLRRPVRDIRSESEGDILEGRVSRDHVLPPVSRPPRDGGSQRVIGQAAAAVRPTERGVPGPASPGPRPLRGEPGGGGRGGNHGRDPAVEQAGFEPDRWTGPGLTSREWVSASRRPRARSISEVIVAKKSRMLLWNLNLTCLRKEIEYVLRLNGDDVVPGLPSDRLGGGSW
jgi:hypothetical protein